MSPSRPFILRPVATSLLMVAILLAGFVAYVQLPVSALPQVDYPTIQVQTFYPGASPEVMASSVTAPLERQFGQIPGLRQMTSTSSGGGSVITLQFSLEESIDVAQQDVQAAINAAYSYLPKDLPNPPVYSKVNPADAPIMTLSLTSDTLPLQRVEDLADTVIAQKISQLSGVGLVSINGGQKPAVRIQANPTALANYGLSLEDIRAAVGTANVDQAKGNLNGATQSYTIGANDQIPSSAGYNNVIIAYRGGSPVRLSDVANAVDSAENLFQAAWMGTSARAASDGQPAKAATLQPAVIVNIQRQPGANIIGVVDEVQKILPQLRSSMPATVNLQVLTDRTNTIRASVKDVKFSLVLTIGLVVMVIFLFLRSFAATVIPSVAVPLSIVGVCGNGDSFGGGAAFDCGHVWRDVSAGIQPEQPVADGVDDLDRVRGGRCDRDDREHLAISGAGRFASRSGVEGLGADRVHDCFADGEFDRGADSAAVHGRYCRAAVQGVCCNSGGYNSGFGARVADADADDVGETVEAYAGERADDVLPEERRVFRLCDREVCGGRTVCAAAPDDDAAGDARHVSADGVPVSDRAEGLLSGAGYGRAAGHY